MRINLAPKANKVLNTDVVMLLTFLQKHANIAAIITTPVSDHIWITK